MRIFTSSSVLRKEHKSYSKACLKTVPEAEADRIAATEELVNVDPNCINANVVRSFI
jgi:hypothetical protein